MSNLPNRMQPTKVRSDRIPQNLHAYVNYTAKPYIYYNGVQIKSKFENESQTHPYRSIVRNPV